MSDNSAQMEVSHQNLKKNCEKPGLTLQQIF